MFKNSTYNHLIWSIFTVATVVMLTSCGHSTPQDVSRSTRSADIVVSSEPSVSDTVQFSSESEEVSVEPSETYDPESWLSRVSDPERYRDTPYKPREYDFSISFKDDILLVTYGQQTVNVYKARYDDVPGRWPDDAPWKVFYGPNVIDWCQGHHGPLSKDEVLNNSYNVHTVSLSEITDADYLAERIGLDINSELLCWTYNTSKLKWASETIQYIPLSPQFLDCLPIRRDHNYGPVLDWGEGIPLSRPSYSSQSAPWSVLFLNSDRTTGAFVDVEKFSIEDVVSENLPVSRVEECLPEIKKAIMYNNFSHRKVATDPNKMELYTVWETDVVVYCMELAYTVLDPTPLEQYDEHLETHELTIVPVWVVYYTATNSKTADENIVYNGTVMLNAVTGKSIYSEMYGPEENDYLYPHAKDLG